jgi:hypothetical protein
MSQITAAQLAQLLVGIARAQQAIIDAIESQRPGFKGNHLLTALQSAAHIRDMHRAPTLADLPARVLMQCQGRNGPDYEHLARELESLLSDMATAAPGAAMATAPKAAAAVAVATADDDLDMTKF